MRRTADHEAFLQATLRHSDLVHALARRLAPRPLDAADIVQETYLRAYAAWGRRVPNDVGAWLATICLNVGRDEQRRHVRRDQRTHDGEIPDLADTAGYADTAEAAIAQIEAERVRVAVWALPEPQRIAITLMDLCGFSAAQVAAITNSPRGSVLSRIHRGRKALAVALSARQDAGKEVGNDA